MLFTQFPLNLYTEHSSSGFTFTNITRNERRFRWRSVFYWIT